MLSLLALSIDRYKILRQTRKKRFSIHLVLPLVWVLSLSMVLPYSAYISHFYLDVSHNISTWLHFLPLYEGSWAWL